MATANEIIRDAMIRHQIGLIRASGTLSKKIIAELRKSEKEVRELLNRRLSEIKERGSDIGPTTTKRLIDIENQLRALLGKTHRKISEEVLDFMGEIVTREPIFVKNVIEDALPVIVNAGVTNTFVMREIVKDFPIDGRILSDWLKKFEENDVERMMDEVRRGLVQGEGIQQIARRIFGTTRLGGQDGVRMISRRGAETLARTLANGVASLDAPMVMIEHDCGVIFGQIRVKGSTSGGARPVIMLEGNDFEGGRFRIDNGDLRTAPQFKIAGKDHNYSIRAKGLSGDERRTLINGKSSMKGIEVR